MGLSSVVIVGVPQWRGLRCAPSCNQENVVTCKFCENCGRPIQEVKGGGKGEKVGQGR